MLQLRSMGTMGRVGRNTWWIFAVSASLALACSEQPKPAADTPEVAEAEEPAPEPVLAPSGLPYSEEREACALRHPLKQAYWGELHVHTNLSMDAYMWDVRGTPSDAYRFAKGQPSLLPPLDETGKMTRPAQLERPLDFAAVTDHASFMGEVTLCTRPGTPQYETEGCQAYRGELPIGDNPLGEFAVRMAGLTSATLTEDDTLPSRHPGLCGENFATCQAAMRGAWRELQDAAERHYDRSSACDFTTFHAYEYTATPGLAKVHHNVIFRNANLPEAPIAYVDEPDVYGLWEQLRDQCTEAGIGCDVLTIPHNSNLSNGRMFVVEGRDLPIDEQRARAKLRAELEPLVEITQIKGDSECRNDMYQVRGAADEFCDYEEWRPSGTEDCEEGASFGALVGKGCVSRTDYVRYTLLEGLREKIRIGINPYKLGIIAATDAHNANPGDVEEYSYQGWRGSSEATREDRLLRDSGVAIAIENVMSNPGGMAGVWAEENSRDSLFDAMQRRETFGTSGPRMTARFFGGWDYPEDLCARADLVSEGYARGVAMGGNLPPQPAGGKAPAFVVSAARDPGIPAHPGGLLQRAQVVKGWVDAAGEFQQVVYDVAGGDNAASVDMDTCEPQGEGSDSLCAVWRDPEFDPSREAVYYLRVLENPSCRWNRLQCLELAANARPESCSDPEVPQVIQERLWSSPIWYDAG